MSARTMAKASIKGTAAEMPAGGNSGVGETKSILGITVASLCWEEALSLLTGLVREKRFTKITFLNAHNDNTACVDPVFAHALDDFMILPDGVGVDIASKLLYGAPFPANLNGTDLVPGLLRAIDEPLTVGLLGATRENAEGACERLQEMAPQHRIVVVQDGFFSPAQEPEIVRHLAELRPDILLVAMGVPRQELWISRNLDGRHCTLPFAVGALLDFMSGSMPRAPLWVRRARLEWVYRLMLEPGRLWRRYVVGNPLFLWRVMRQKLTGKEMLARRQRLAD